ncbi:hypothetical protein E2562_030666 [Oryza meyeriana var. granulata]|uniref:Uncharacterized protein n=2 Tax=Oryza meyeriana var. granulata TaxID=110450 RepID=A0A6G1DQ08_9ORYZ|nr:hypothetical protein E2562_030666 [Oryza meyeriana var. granulata]
MTGMRISKHESRLNSRPASYATWLSLVPRFVPLSQPSDHKSTVRDRCGGSRCKIRKLRGFFCKHSGSPPNLLTLDRGGEQPPAAGPPPSTASAASSRPPPSASPPLHSCTRAGLLAATPQLERRRHQGGYKEKIQEARHPRTTLPPTPKSSPPMKKIFGSKKNQEPPPSIQDATDRISKRGDSVDEKIKKLDAELARYKDQIKKTSPSPAQEPIKARAMRLLKQRRICGIQTQIVSSFSFK